MINEFANATAPRSWRDIPQPVKPRAMSRGGRRRRATAGLRSAVGIGFTAMILWVGWVILGALQRNPRQVPAAARNLPIQPPELRSDGVLGHDWLGRQLALPKGASLMELDLERLQTRLLADGQVMAVTLRRHFPDRLLVTLTERSPIARVMVEWQGRQQRLLVGRDGVVFAGEGYEQAMIARLPWLDGITLARRKSGFVPIEGMNTVAELVARARETEPRQADEDPRRTWKVISLARLAADRELEVQTEAGTTVVFAANGDFLRQVSKLDFLWEQLALAPTVPARIDLTLGREVPVLVEALPVQSPAPAVAPPFQARTRREF